MPRRPKPPAPRPVQDLHRGDRTTFFSHEQGRATVEFNWEGMGCPREICCRLGDQQVFVPLPPGFPREALAYREEIPVEGGPQTLEIVSAPDRTVANAQITVSTAKLSAPFQIKLGGHQILAGFVWVCPVDRQPVYDHEGNLLYYIVWVQGGAIGGKPCRPNCRYNSSLQSVLEYPWREEYADIEEDIIIQHYKRRVDYNWASYHCEDGKWKFLRNDVDTQTERKAVPKRIEK